MPFLMDSMYKIKRTYSSRTREWRRSRLISDVPVKVSFGTPPSFGGGFFHWFAPDGKSIVAFDPSSLDEEDKEDHCNRGFVPKKHVIQVIKTPCDSFSRVVWRSDNGQTIWFCGSDYYSGVEVFRKRDESDEWAFVSRVPSQATMVKDVLGITQKDIEDELAISEKDCLEEFDFTRQMLKMLAFIPWNPRLVVMRYWDRIYVYDCIKKKLDHQVQLDQECHYTEYTWDWTPYFRSLENSTLNLEYDHCFSI